MSGHVWARWNLDPAILAGLALLASAYLAGVRRLWTAKRGRGVRGRQVASFLMGTGALLVAVVSPVEHAAEEVLSAHMAQHLILILVAAPLLALGRPGLVLLAALPAGWRRRVHRVARRPGVHRATLVLMTPVLVWLVHVTVVWGWHVPGAFQAALDHEPVHWLEHAAFVGTAVPFWGLALAPGTSRRLPRGGDVLYLVTAWLQGGALGALFTFAPSPVYPAYAAHAVALGIDPLHDQQVAGLIMWIPAGMVYLAGACALFVAWLQAVDRAVRRAEAETGPVMAEAGPPGRVRA